MSTIAPIGTLLAGLGGLLMGGAAVYTAVKPSEITTYPELEKRLDQLENLISPEGLAPGDSSLNSLQRKLDAFGKTLEVATSNKANSALFVPNLLSSLTTYESGQVFDFTAPNGATKLLKANVSGTILTLKVDGQQSHSADTGGHIALDFEGQTCKFENISAIPSKSAVVRSSCVSN
ncbi:hypothetical protein VWX97_15645 [Phaeobacter sp. JH18-32]|uniref:hypothetical protein n=1 Tax=Phaeobacter TaxID=302485 RepID=UPI003A891A56